MLPWSLNFTKYIVGGEFYMECKFLMTPSDLCDVMRNVKRQWLYLVLLFLLLRKMFPLRNSFEHLQDDLHCFIKRWLDLLRAWSHHHLWDGEDNIGLEQWHLLVRHVLERVAISELYTTLDSIKRHARACREKTSPQIN